ncbi:MAG: hypothetical protein IAE77_09135 [Prosthecobacter sp.]|jgi:hypothetical protein|uniref:hypothetical protein n=1 Tax=Prosthecobacter sp. TaxID=1965333 RepID=UPI0019EB86AE|nr:hypothetical protein [Prosthecobacter sp.]MBE2283605.1 hypothetical protein [Prosthecobacter sp.]
MKHILLSLAVVLTACRLTAAEFPGFDSDINADLWLKQNSKTYQKMASNLDADGGYLLTKATATENGNFYNAQGRRCIGIPADQTGARRVCHLILHVANATHESATKAVDAELREGGIKNADEFADRLFDTFYLAHAELYQVLGELDAKLGRLPADALNYWGDRGAQTYRDLKMPSKAELKATHQATLDHWRSWFAKQRK